MGVKLEWEFYRDNCIGMDDRLMIRAIAGHYDPPREFDELWALYGQKTNLFRERTLAAPPFDPRLDRFLSDLHGGYKLGVVSSTSTGEIGPLLEKGGLRRHFDTVVGGDSVRHLKPSPEPYQLASQRLGVRSALVVEDSAAGIASGRAAGFEVVPITSPAAMPALVAQRLSGATP